MPVRNSTDAGLSYYLLAFDRAGTERNEENGEMLSRHVLNNCGKSPPTDVFLVSHGWMGDIPAAVRQYDKWTWAMHECAADRNALETARSGFRPLIVGLHWPSLPWGDEELGPASFSAQGGGGLEQWIARYAERIAGTPAARQALRAIFQAALDNIAPVSLPPAVREAYLILDRESGMGSGGEGPDEDREAFDPDFVFEEAAGDDMASYDAPWYGGVLSPLRTLSFWKMKNRARLFGEGPARNLLRDLQQTSAGTTRFHLAGHSFGSIVVASMVRGADDAPPLDRPVDTLVMMQGALSLWSFCGDLPHRRGTPGYFHSVVSEDRVAGPIVTTQSEHDTAVGVLYPFAAGFRRQVSYAPGKLPKYGALGAFGARGPGIRVTDRTMASVDQDYRFQAGMIYNLDATRYICDGRGSSGAHNDIAKPEVAHAIWQACLRRERLSR